MTKKKLRYYLAHPILRRYEVREKELEFEEKTGIELVNPFYDTYEREDMKEIDKGKIKPWDRNLDYIRIVEKDLKTIDSCVGIIAYVYKEYSIGTYMELWYGMTHNKVIYIVTSSCSTHPWLKYVVNKTNGRIVKSFKELEELLKC